jgi:hypothetical protein
MSYRIAEGRCNAASVPIPKPWQLAGWSNRQIADMLREAGAIEEISRRGIAYFRRVVDGA